MSQVTGIRKRRRPSIAMVVAGVCAALVSVPLIALLALRLTSNQFVRETEQSLIQQAAIYAELYASAFSPLPGPTIGTALTDAQKQHWGQDLHPARALLNVRHDPVLPPRPAGDPVSTEIDPRYMAIIDPLVSIARGAQQTTFSGVAFLSHDGRLLNAPGAPSLGDLVEVQAALGGDIGRVLRLRGDGNKVHPLASLSRDTGFRVFVAYPVIVADRVIGAVHISRTPLNLGKFLYQERSAILTMFVVMLALASLIGWVLIRLISRPVTGLRDAAMAVAEGHKDHAAALPHYGFRELATLGESVEQMAATLTKRSQEITTYSDHVTHELKSPVTTIVAAAELLQGDGLADDDRLKLLDNIAAEGHRMNALLEQLREMTQARTMAPGEPGKLCEMIPQVDGLRIDNGCPEDTQLPLTVEHGRMILLHMAQNAQAHNAQTLRISRDGHVLTLADDGDGIEAEDIDRLSEPFFTTRRDTGGTGMGLAICKTILEGYGATLRAKPGNKGAIFQIVFRR
ncbi:ATP-binding protein [uncultured Roseobacter sp.]|uniref:ATP-binding protein n=1 Tax=uncultured Roseobacter sp. TaxID=114847 RepID=UPI002613E3ED|nr:ATP-binding protein [uncultured Roseobacter sp.]